AALDFLHRRARRAAHHSDEDPDMMTDPAAVVADREIAATSLRTFMRLPAMQRSSIILMDVLGYSLEEIGAVTDTAIPSSKASLHRGRARRGDGALEPDGAPPPALPGPKRAQLEAYVARFNARDRDGVRAMLADEVRLDLVARHKLAGRGEVSRY